MNFPRSPKAARLIFSLLFAIGFLLTSFSSQRVSSPAQASADSACIFETFEGPALNPGWVWVDPLGGASYSLSANPGYLRIVAPNGNRDLATFNKNAPRLLRSISGDFDIQTKLTINPFDGYQSAGLLMWFDDANFIWIGRSVGNVIGHNYVRNGTNEGLNPPQPDYSAATIHFRMVRQGSTFSTYYSQNGFSWVLTGSLTYTSTPSAVSAGVFLINNWQDNPISADFDFFKINCPQHQVFLPAITRPEKPAVMEKVVFTIAYLDAVPVNDPEDHQKEFLAGLRQASTWHGYANPDGQPALGYKTYGGSVMRLYETPPYRSDTGQFDYAAVYARFDLCTKIQQGLVDEVWIWESGDGNAWEWVTNGPNWSWTWGSNVPNCGRTVTTLNLNYQREIDVAYESYTHRLEGAFMTHFPCDFYTDTWPWTGSPSQCNGLVSDRFGFVARPFAGNHSVGVCGDAHHPPNILDNREYIYDDPAAVQSICKDWQWDGSGKVSTFSCTEWGCTHQGFHIWWMQNLPGYGNNNRDRYGNWMPNWWESLFW